MTRQVRLTSICCGAWVMTTLSTAVPSAVTGQERSLRPTPRLPSMSMGGTRVDYGVVLSPYLIWYNTGLERPGASDPSVLHVAAGLGGRYLVDYTSARHPVGSGWDAVVHVGVARLTKERFYGFGNRTTATAPSRFYDASQTRYVVEPTFSPSGLTGAVRWSLGPLFKYTSSEDDFDFDRFGRFEADEVNFIQANPTYGVGRFKQVGLQTDLRIGTLSAARGPLGLEAQAGGAFYPAVLDVVSPFGEVHGQLRGLLMTAAPLSPTLAVRVGGKLVMGEVPFHEAAYLGGARSLRGFGEQRFAGDAVVFGGAELRLALGRFDFFHHSTRFGVLGLADVGRVYVDGASPGGWHAVRGAGFWFEPSGMRGAVSVEMARGPEGTHLYLRTGIAF